MTLAPVKGVSDEVRGELSDIFGIEIDSFNEKRLVPKVLESWSFYQMALGTQKTQLHKNTAGMDSLPKLASLQYVIQTFIRPITSWRAKNRQAIS